MSKTEDLYGKQSFERLREANCFQVYNRHILMLEETLAEATAKGQYDRCYRLQKAQARFRVLIAQARDAR